ncbi:hypothetical protein [Niallia sp.]|uniref:hypothetical protein n=1 Tax=Niallia sp. TaxID=2837523 RepID=UPI00289FA0C8|nr:hypothetical protein [Niallia sp.]
MNQKEVKGKAGLNISIWSIALLLLIGFGTYGFYHHFSTNTIEDSVVSAEGEAIDISIEASKSTEKEAEVDISKIDYEYWHEYRVISTMHEMTHQKVHASP